MAQISPDQDAELDHLMDTRGISALDARAELNITVPDDLEFSANAIEHRLAATRQRQEDHAADAILYRQTGVMTSQEAAAQRKINENRPQMPWEDKKGA